MKPTHTFLYLFCFLILCSISFCCQTTLGEALVTSYSSTQPADSIKIYSYDSLNVPDFFGQLCVNHCGDVTKRFGENFTLWCSTEGVDEKDSVNVLKYNSIILLHKIFTATGASNGSTGDVLNIPYMWHWVSPNPRHEIICVADNKLLKDKKPPKDYGKYATYADIDRTPFLFISEMLSPTPLYSHPGCGEFSSFGWCSEREMAFSCLVEMMGYDAHVIASGNHSWSELKVEMKTGTGIKTFVVAVDNTFDSINWTDDEDKLEQWNDSNGDSPMAKWYNDKAHSTGEMEKLKKFTVSSDRAVQVDKVVGVYLTK